MTAAAAPSHEPRALRDLINFSSELPLRYAVREYLQEISTAHGQMVVNDQFQKNVSVGNIQGKVPSRQIGRGAQILTQRQTPAKIKKIVATGDISASHAQEKPRGVAN